MIEIAKEFPVFIVALKALSLACTLHKHKKIFILFYFIFFPIGDCVMREIAHESGPERIRF
jgi:hypothetical protein